jgi:peptidoglycan hydrolase-like protein with peptidoglycan-binding domain
MENSQFVYSTTSSGITPGSRTLQLKSPMMRGDDVRYVQLRVGATPDGIFGPKTESKVKGFQMLNLLQPTGVVDFMTWLKLHSVTPKDTGSSGSGGSGGSQAVTITDMVSSDSKKKWMVLGVAALGVGVAVAAYRSK